SAKLTERAVCTYIFNKSMVASTVFFLSSYELCTLRRNPTALSAPFGGTSPIGRGKWSVQIPNRLIN
ncbi:MAG: hypothetical protein IKT58_00195, partial [Oscillospiraceae bacterium]|nr:hypothetical protein [Oscillospiraceae bacterium]